MREDIRDFNVDHLADKPRAALEGDDAVVVGSRRKHPLTLFRRARYQAALNVAEHGLGNFRGAGVVDGLQMLQTL